MDFSQYKTPLPICPDNALPGLLGQLVSERSMGSSHERALATGMLNAVVSHAAAVHARHRTIDGDIAPGTTFSIVDSPTGSGSSKHLRALLLPFNQTDDPWLTDDITVQTFPKLLEKSPMLGQICDEGDQALVGMNSRVIGAYCKAWTGDPLRVDRVSTGKAVARQVMFTLLLLTHPETLQDFRSGHAKNMRASGFEPRVLYTVVDIPPMDHFPAPPLEIAYAKYQARIKDMLETSVQFVNQDVENAPVQSFSPAATRVLHGVRMRCMQASQPGGPLAPSRDYVAKIVANIQRLASSWHAFNGCVGDISSEYVERADYLCAYHLDVYRAMTWTPPILPQVEQDAQALEAALWSRAHATGQFWMPEREVITYAPNIHLTKARAKCALELLCWYRRAQLVVRKIGRRDVCCIELLPRQPFPLR
ncbi:DUF3987 domain-containing protein [Bordetella petrii]|uniref:DUF3987 domain-containing protein n=1 Tax=Bordetella petrii TaxID=94624 RepID=UPI001A95F7E6|nr:DUF3987 domain-containing protein [Bordetella petrii]MBO1111828.1 DUF3987 domain-containing protein [Bordetella petrii]